MKKEIIRIENGIVSVPVSSEIWMTQHQLADLFQCFVGKINANVRAILKTGVFYESDVVGFIIIRTIVLLNNIVWKLSLRWRSVLSRKMQKCSAVG